MGSIIYMSGAGTGGTENAVAQIDLPMATRLVGLQWAMDNECDADNDSCSWQLSFRSTYASSNDDRAIISEITSKYSLTTSGVYQGHENLYVALPDIPLMGGERLYLHVAATAATISAASCILHLSDDLDKPSIRRR